MMYLLDSVSVLFLLFYLLLILIYWIGWLLIPVFNAGIRKTSERTGPESESHQDANKFSIVIAVRNEEDTITKCLSDLVQQNYDPENYELIIVNDYSTDQTEKVVLEFAARHPGFRINHLHMRDDPGKTQLKKAAITTGISHARFGYIILTDADCGRGINWLYAVDQFIRLKRAKFIYAPVEFRASGFFETIQALEFAGLVGIGASAIRLKQPNMCSAANLIFEKQVFNAVEGYKGYDGIASGDDEFLMHKVFRKFPDGVHFMKCRDAIVFTSPNITIAQLAGQRRRWVSKSTKYDNRYITAILIAAYLFNALILFNLLFHFRLGLMMLFAKMLMEGLFLLSVLHFFKRMKYLFYLPLAELFHIIYVLVIGIWANTGSYNWKGRNLK